MMSRAETMGLYGAERTSEPWHLVRKVFLLLLLVVALALGLVLLLERGHPAPMLMFNVLADASIGAIMGIGSRLVLRRRSWLIQIVVAASLSIVGLVVLGVLTDARSGVGPIYLELRRVHWLDGAGIPLRVPEIPGNSPTDLLDAVHLLVAVDLSWIALRAWRSKPRFLDASAQPSSLPRSGSVSPAPVRMSSMPRPVAPVVRPITHSGSRPVIRQRKVGHSLVQRAIAVRPKNAGSRRRSPFGRRMAVQLAAYEEHRCPYCLQDIKRDDIRGSVECPICHTLHHKDCWDITGTCQVPHLNG